MDAQILNHVNILLEIGFIFDLEYVLNIDLKYDLEYDMFSVELMRAQEVLGTLEGHLVWIAFWVVV